MRIVVAGAGIGGLSLANTLTQLAKNAHITIVERDRDIASRPQGYGINLNQGAGLAVLRRLGFADQSEKFMQVNRGLRFVTHAGRPLVVLPAGSPNTKFYVAAMSREKLRTMLLGGIELDKVRWNCAVANYEQDKEKVRIKLDDGTELTADLLIACDGVRSAVRAQMIGDELSYIGISQIGGDIDEGSVDHPLLNSGSLMMLGPQKSVFVVKYGPRIQWNLGLRVPQAAFNDLTPAELRARALREVNGWAAPIPEIIRATAEDRFRTRILCDRPPPTRLVDGRVVLMGDAAHPLSPYRGQGANSAMLDALTLGELIGATTEATRASELARWERETIGRVGPLVLRSREVALEYHTRSPLVALRRNLRMRSLRASIGVRQWAHEHLGYQPNWVS
jgi:salicylate hydroxylase